MTPFVAATLAATIVGVVSPPVVLIAPSALTLNDWPRSVSMILLWPAFLGSTLQTLAAVRGPNGDARKAASVGAKTVSCCPLVRAVATAGSAHPTAATK